jgi:hypothetical protein
MSPNRLKKNDIFLVHAGDLAFGTACRGLHEGAATSLPAGGAGMLPKLAYRGITEANLRRLVIANPAAAY